ncbi:MAG: glycosyltransferase family 2 protein [Polyangiaceae bacterium]
MLIHAHVLAWNEARIAPLFLDHYHWVDRIYVHDNLSTDGSVAVWSADERVTVLPYDTQGQIRDDEYVRIKNTAWKLHSAAADWVLVVDADEFLWMPKPRQLLQRLRSAPDANAYAMVLPVGWEVIADGIPEFPASASTPEQRLAHWARRGMRSDWYSKPCLFQPSFLAETNYRPGAHVAKPVFRNGQGWVAEERDAQGRELRTGQPGDDRDFELLHMKMAMGAEHQEQRRRAYATRLSAINKVNGWGAEYQDEDFVAQQRELTRLHSVELTFLGRPR